jgi:hypothetical protein
MGNPQSTILATLLIATFLRLFHLPTLPPGLNFDEAGSGVAALEILSGAPKIWWRLGGGQEPLWPYLTALSTAVLGNMALALRLPAALVGILSVAAVYPLLLALRPGGSGTNRRDAHLIALLAALGLALSDWHLHFSRLGFRAILLPLLSTLAFYFFWHSLKVSRFMFHVYVNISLVMASLFTALAIHSYLAARLLLLVPLLFFTLQWLIGRIRRLLPAQNNPASASPQTLPFFPASSLSFLISYFLFLLLFLSPLILYFSLNPADFVARSTTVSIFNPAWNNGDLFGTAWQTLTATLDTFFGLQGDSNPLVNLPGEPALPPLLVPFFCLGMLLSLYRSFFPTFEPSSRRPPMGNLPTPSPHLFLLCWWTIMLLPALLAPEGAPHHLRLLGAIVPTYVFVAIGLVATTNFLISYASRFMPPASASRLTYLLPATCYLLLAVQTYTNYFVRWPASVDFTLPFDLYAVRLAGDIAQSPPGVGYVLPMDLRAGEEARHYTLDYLLGFHQSRPYTYIPVDEHSAAALLTQAADSKQQLRVVRWTNDKHREADAKEIVTYLLATTAHFQGRESFPVYDIETYTLPDSRTIFSLPIINQPIGANFDNLLRLDAAFVPSSAQPGADLPIALTVAPLAPMPVNYKISLRLINPGGQRVAQKDRLLLHNFHQGTSLWPPETVNEYYLLPVPPEASPGVYTVVTVIYQPETLAPLIAAGQAEVPVGQVSLK